MIDRLPIVGTSLARVDGVAKVAGAARYVDDHHPPGTLWGRTVRSAVPHGVLRAVRRDPAFDWDGVVFATADDVPGENVVALIVDDQPALLPVGGTIRHVAEPVALVAAETKERAEAAWRAVSLEVESRPAVFDLEEALRDETRVFKRYRIDTGGVDEAMARAAHVVEGVYRTGAQEQMYIEPQGMLAEWLPGGACRVLGSMQCPYYVHKALVRALGLPGEKVVVEQAVTGGGFGGKEEYPSILAIHAAVLARKAGRTVKVVYERDEDVAATTKRHPSIVRHRLGLDRDGTFLAADVDVALDGGAYATLSAVVLSRGVLHAPGPYRIPHVRVAGRVVATNHPPHGAFRGFGAPQTTFAYERQVQKAARRLGIDPFELRRQNRLRPGDSTATGQALVDSVGSAEVLGAVERAWALPSPYRRDHAVPDGRRRGRGLAFYFHGAGFTGSGEARLAGRATVAATAGGFEIRSSSTDIGQGTLTTFVQIAADALGVGAVDVRFGEARTGRDPDSGPTVASRTCMIVGRLVQDAAGEVRERLTAWGRERGRDVTDRVAGARARAALEGELAVTRTYAPPAGIRWDDDAYRGDAYPVYGWAACAVEVAVDPDTLEVEIERCVQAVDVGKAIHPTIVLGQIDGGAVQAFGWALWESVQYREGRVANDRMTSCIIPTAIEAPEMETSLVEVPYPHGPDGAKGVGEIPIDGPAAAVAGAIEDALGLAADELPLLPEVLERLAREVRP